MGEARQCGATACAAAEVFFYDVIDELYINVSLWCLSTRWILYESFTPPFAVYISSWTPHNRENGVYSQGCIRSATTAVGTDSFQERPSCTRRTRKPVINTPESLDIAELIPPLANGRLLLPHREDYLSSLHAGILYIS